VRSFLLILLFLAHTARAEFFPLPGGTEEINFHIETAANKTYYLVPQAAYARTVQSIWIQCLSGTITAALKIGGTNVTSCNGLSVSSSSGSTTCTAANALAASGVLTLATTSNAVCLDLIGTVTLKK
jgi:hypothetical protein